MAPVIAFEHNERRKALVLSLRVLCQNRPNVVSKENLMCQKDLIFEHNERRKARVLSVRGEAAGEMGEGREGREGGCE